MTNKEDNISQMSKDVCKQNKVPQNVYKDTYRICHRKDLKINK